MSTPCSRWFFCHKRTSGVRPSTWPKTKQATVNIQVRTSQVQSPRGSEKNGLGDLAIFGAMVVLPLFEKTAGCWVIYGPFAFLFLLLFSLQ